MSYANTGLRCVTTGFAGSNAVFVYQSADAHTDVDAAGYFTDGVSFGMKVNDVVIVIDTNTPTTTVHRVASVSGAAATISSATLA